jgi:uncharacterized protein (TIGR00369 family)
MADDMSPNLAPMFMERQLGALPDLLGLEWEIIQKGFAKGRFRVETRHMAPNGFLHAASVIALADTACGYGCVASLPEGAGGFTTVELKSNFVGTARDGHVNCEARLIHGGRTTQVWDAEVRHEESGKLMALFRCTQSILQPRS